jgi:integrase
MAADRQGLKKFVPPVAQRTTVGELLDDYQADIELRGLKSARKVLYHAKPVRAQFGTMRAVDVAADANIVDRYIKAKLAAGKSNATVNRQTTILCSAFKLAKQRGKVAAVPLIRKLRENNVRRVCIDRDEFEALVAAAPEYLQDAIRFFYACGWRKGEVSGLKWESVDLAAGKVTLPDAKAGSRALAVTGELLEILKRRQSARLVEVPDGLGGTTVKLAEYVFHRQGEPV